MARRSDALYADGTRGMTRRMLCDMVAQRESDLEDARAENAKLRDERDGWKKLCVDQEVMHIRREETLDNENTKLRERVAELEGLTNGKRYIPQEWYQLSTAENAKLRELVSGLEHCAQGFSCGWCPLYDPSCTNHYRCTSLERELGIEVDE
jgi:hypothetical protein